MDELRIAPADDRAVDARRYFEAGVLDQPPQACANRGPRWSL
jgi:hypothetical protein